VLVEYHKTLKIIQAKQILIRPVLLNLDDDMFQFAQEFVLETRKQIEQLLTDKIKVPKSCSAQQVLVKQCFIPETYCSVTFDAYNIQDLVLTMKQFNL